MNQRADNAARAPAGDTAAQLAARPRQSLADQAVRFAQGLARLHAEAAIHGEHGPDLDLMADSLHAWARRLRR